jgi:hypothetical protein
MRIDEKRPGAVPATSGTERRHSAIIGTIKKWRSYDAWNKTAQKTWEPAIGPSPSPPAAPKPKA